MTEKERRNLTGLIALFFLTMFVCTQTLIGVAFVSHPVWETFGIWFLGGLPTYALLRLSLWGLR